MKKGHELILSVDGMITAAAKECSMKTDQEFIQVCSPKTGRFREVKPSTMGWSVSTSMLVPTAENPKAWLDEMKTSAHPLTMRFRDDEMKMYVCGECYIQSWEMSARVGSLQTFAVSLIGTGEPRVNDDRDYPFFQDGVLYTKATFEEGEDGGVLDMGGVFDSETGTWSRE